MICILFNGHPLLVLLCYICVQMDISKQLVALFYSGFQVNHIMFTAR